MKILMIHTRYRERGGEDSAFDRERDLLAARGHEVRCFVRDNADTADMSAPARAASAVWSRSAYDEVLALCRDFAPDVAHVHNTHYAASPAAIAAAKASGAATVMTLHNFRLLCVNALLYRDGTPCEDCVGRRIKWPGILHGCFRGSRAGSATVAATLAFHAARGTWSKDVDRYVALSEFSRARFAAGGLPADRISVKANFADAPESIPDWRQRTRTALYAGRLSEEKGVRTLVAAWRDIDADLVIAGDGPLREELMAAAGPRVRFAGALAPASLSREMAGAMLLVCPSQCYENFPMVIAEAYAHGLPVAASRIGALPELVEDGVTGALFPPGDAAALRDCVGGLLADDPGAAARSAAARARYDATCSPERIYEKLMEIYGFALIR